MPDERELARFETGPGFVAALDQSGGSTPKALRLYGIDESRYETEAEMFDLIHHARTRIILSPAFTSDRVLGAILFQGTLDREITGQRAAQYLREVKGIIPFVKIDKGLAERHDGVQLMRDIPDLDGVLARAREDGVFGTKERSVIHAANPRGIAHAVAQQFDVAERVLAADLMPIVEPEVSIDAPEKEEAESLVKEEILRRLVTLGEHKVALKLTIPSVDAYYSDLIGHPNVARVLALSGGYSRDDANARLARNPGLIASFSRALLDGLTAQQSAEEFDRSLAASIDSISRASAN